MKDNILSLFVAASGEILNIKQGELSLAVMQKHVGGLIEYAVVGTPYGFPVPSSVLGVDREGYEAGLLKVCDVIVNENGIALGLPPNAISTFAAYGQGVDCDYPLLGPSIIQVEIPEDTDGVEWVSFDWIIDKTIPKHLQGDADMVKKIMGELEEEMTNIKLGLENKNLGYQVLDYGLTRLQSEADARGEEE